MATDSPIPIQIETPGIESHNRAQLVALSELQTELRAAGFDVDLPPESRGGWIPTPDEAREVLKYVEIWFGAEVAVLTHKALEDSVNAAYGKAKSWAKNQITKRRKPDEIPPRTVKVVFFGPDGKPLKTIDVPDDSDDGQGGA